MARGCIAYHGFEQVSVPPQDQPETGAGAKELNRAGNKTSSDNRSEARRSQVGSGDRSERIRTYNFPQGRVTDHRINLTLYKLDRIMEGDLDELISALISDYQTALLAQMNESF